MENAAKALLMIAEILIGIIIISIGVYIFTTYRNVNKNYEYEMQISELNEYNKIFTIFEGRQDISAQEIVTLINQLRNLGYSEEEIFKGAEPIVRLNVPDSDFPNSFSDLTNFLKVSYNADNTIKTYTCYLQWESAYPNADLSTDLKDKLSKEYLKVKYIKFKKT